MGTQFADPLAGFVYARATQCQNTLAVSFNGPFTFDADVSISEETENAFRLLSLRTPPPQGAAALRPVQPPPSAPQRQQGLPASATSQQPPAPAPRLAAPPPAPAAAPVARGTAPTSAAPTSGFDEDDDSFLDGLDVDLMVLEHRRQAQPPPGSAPPAGSGVLPPRPSQHGAAPAASALIAPQRQQPPQQQHQQQWGVSQQWGASPQQPPPQQPASGRLCSHGLAYERCPHRQQHLAEVKGQLADAALRMVDASGEEDVQAIKEEMQQYKELKQLLDSAPPPPTTAGGGASFQPALQQQQPYQHGGGGGGGVSYGASGSGPHYQQQQQQQQQVPAWSSARGAGLTGGYQGGDGGQYGAGALPAQAGGGASTYGGGSSGNYGGGGCGGTNGSAGGSYGGGFGGGGFGGQAQGGVGPAAPWSPNKQALGAVRAERQDATNDPQWKREDFSWSQDLHHHNRATFGNTGFRHSQLSIINATLSKRDVFVLMPTGGGKSLCYQLPALVSDAGISAESLGGNMTWEEQRGVYDRLASTKVLFVTPEKLSASGALRSALDRLHRDGLLARVVVDEASAGPFYFADFRKDYTRLGVLKQQYPDVPLLALTATATERVQHDVVQQLAIQQCLLFKSSFNRPNLRYEVRRKKKVAACIQEISKEMAERYVDRIGNNKRAWRLQSGIVYCLARAECERVAEELEGQLAELLGGRLSSGRRRVKHYHASLSPEEREAVQMEWTNGDVACIVATIAFGMGINKADVRYVYHFSLPKAGVGCGGVGAGLSLEGYLQESGRAGRDGRPAACTLYYTFADAAKSRHMLKQSAAENRTPPEQLRCNMESLNAMVAYCEEEVECRRVLLLSHFGERTFRREACRGTCDNCAANAGRAVVELDLTEAAKKVVEVLRATGPCSVSQLVDVFRGNNTVGVRKHRHDQLPVHGLGRALCKNNGEAERLVRQLVVRGILVEETHRPETHLAVISTLNVAPQPAAALAAGRLRVVVQSLAPAGQEGGAKGKGRFVKAAGGRVGGKAGAQAAQAAAGAAAPAAEDDPIIDLCEHEEPEEAPEEALRRQLVQVALAELNKVLRTSLSMTRAPLPTTVQSLLAKAAPTSEEQLAALSLNGLSEAMKRKYGRYILAAVGQALVFLGAVQAGAAQAEDFALDSAAVMQAEAAGAATKRQRVDEWSDDDWVAAPRPTTKPPAKQARVDGGPKSGPFPASFDAFRCAPQQQQQQQQQQQAARLALPPRPSSAGPFGPRSGVDLAAARAAGGVAPTGGPGAPLEAGEWRTKKSTPAPGKHPAPVQQQQQQHTQGSRAVQSVQVNVSDAFGRGWGGGGR
eukprot:scaffold5.g649.t1